MQLVRIALVWIVAVFAVHGILRVYLRSLRREALENAWDRGEGGALSRDDYVAAEMVRFDRSLLLKIIALVYVLPVIVVGGIIYFVNYN